MTFPTYSTGTVSVADDGTVVSGTGTLWQRSNAREGDKIVIDPTNGYPELTILSIDDTDQLTLAQPWTYGTKTDVTYKIIKSSIDRTVGRRSFDDMDAVIAALNASGFFVFVGTDETVPDPSIGDDGQYALQPSTGKLWFKEDGSWTLLGIYAALSIDPDNPAWQSGTTYLVNRVVTRLGKTYFAKRTTVGDPPESSPDDWGLLISNGDRYDIAIFDTDRPSSGETIAKWVAPSSTVFPQNLTDSKSSADVAATASSVFSFRKNGVQFATLTFAISGTVGTWTCAADTTFAASDVLTVISPNPRDATLAGVAITLVGFRS